MPSLFFDGVRIGKYAFNVLAFMVGMFAGPSGLLLMTAMIEDHERTQRRYMKWTAETERQKVMQCQ